MDNKYKFTDSCNWWFEDHENNFDQIKKYFDGQIDLNFLEIGVFEARTTTWLLDNILTSPQDKIYCIDPYIKQNGLHNLSLHSEKVRFFGRASIDVLSDLLPHRRQFFNFVYIDGDHNACGILEDAVISWRMLKVGGIMLFDDYEMEITEPWFYRSHQCFKLSSSPRLSFTHPRFAIDAFLSIYKGQYEKIIENYQIGIKKVVELNLCVEI